MKYIRICPTNGCGNEISYNRKDSYKNAINKNCVCPKCNRAKRGAIYYKFLDDSIVKSVLSIYYDKNKTLTIIADECNISFETLNKIIKSNKLPPIKRENKIIDRAESYRKMFKSRYGIEYDEYLKTKPIFDKYKTKVKYYTGKTVKKFGKYIDNLDKVGKGENAYHIDHIVSIKECFINNVDPKIAADSINLRAIPWYENLSKGTDSLFTAEILVSNVTERNKYKIKISELWNFL
jgi:hypothetical protein